jgi:hypothetical protein
MPRHEQAVPLLEEKGSDHVYEFSPDFLAVYRQRLRAHRDDVNNKMRILDEIAAILSDDEEEESSEEEDEDEVFEDGMRGCCVRRNRRNSSLLCTAHTSSTRMTCVSACRRCLRMHVSAYGRMISLMYCRIVAWLLQWFSLKVR